MNHWTADGIPTFAVVGRINMGKSAVLATLLEIDDDHLIRVSPTPGETTRCQVLPVEFDGTEHLRFIDTPGFARPVDALHAIERLAAGNPPGLAELGRFVRDLRDEFPDECQLLEPVVEGAGVIYVVDPSKPVRDASLAEIEILRWSGRPRLAVLNCKEERAEFEEEWRLRLGAAFNLVRTFNAHHARYAERRRLLTSLLEIEEHHAERISRVLDSLAGEWGQRREEAAEAILDFLESALALRVDAAASERELDAPRRRERLERELAGRYFQQLATLDRGCLQALLRIHRHHLLEPAAGDDAYTGLDLRGAESWRKFGLNRWQLALAGALAGGAAGLAVDVSLGGATHGAGTVLGGLGAGVAAFFKGDRLPELAVRRGVPTIAAGGARKLVVGPPDSPNFPWVLLDSVLVGYRRILARAHGRRDREPLAAGPAERGGITGRLPGERRALLQKWFNSCLKGKPARGLEPDVYQSLVATLGELEDGA
jgi:hypothetical protein